MVINTKNDTSVINKNISKNKDSKINEKESLFLKAWEDARENKIESVSTGSQSYSNKEWERLLAKFDKMEAKIKEEVKNEIEERLRIGDCSDKNKCVTVHLEKGGQLIFNKDNIEDLVSVFGQFSAEDQKRILYALANDNQMNTHENWIDNDQLVHRYDYDEMDIF